MRSLLTIAILSLSLLAGCASMKHGACGCDKANAKCECSAGQDCKDGECATEKKN